MSINILYTHHVEIRTVPVFKGNIASAVVKVLKSRWLSTLFKGGSLCREHWMESGYLIWGAC